MELWIPCQDPLYNFSPSWSSWTGADLEWEGWAKKAAGEWFAISVNDADRDEVGMKVTVDGWWWWWWSEKVKQAEWSAKWGVLLSGRRRDHTETCLSSCKSFKICFCTPACLAMLIIGTSCYWQCYVLKAFSWYACQCICWQCSKLQKTSNNVESLTCDETPPP